MGGGTKGSLRKAQRKNRPLLNVVTVIKEFLKL